MLEKDLWVVQTLDVLFSATFGQHLIFKGGTSLSKAYEVIHRFSEDIDITVDIRRLLPEETSSSEFPPSRKQARKWRDRIEKIRLPELIENEILPQLEAQLPRGVKLDHAGTNVMVDYSDPGIVRRASSSALSLYVESVVKIEFGGASTGEPNHKTDITCDISKAEAADGIEFPRAHARVMDIERTFWEKATLAHVACIKGRKDWTRYARHWYDLVQIYQSVYWDDCSRDLHTARLVARVKTHFYRESGVDYEKAVGGNIVITPEGASLESLRDDYEDMVESGMFDREVEPFDELMRKCDEIADALNSRNLV